MQWPPTNPGENFRKFHLVPAASSTSYVLMPILLKMMDNSFIKAILTSRCVFSMILAASATLILEALCTPGSTMILYVSAIISDDSSSHPETTFRILVIVCSLSPGFMRSGE